MEPIYTPATSERIWAWVYITFDQIDWRDQIDLGLQYIFSAGVEGPSLADIMEDLVHYEGQFRL